MFDKNWNILITVLIIVLVIAYFCNNYEGFATNNDEAIATIASVYNKDNMTVTNLTVPGKTTMGVDNWHTSTDGKNRLYFATNARTYFGSQDGYEWRDKTDKPIMTIGDNGVLRTRNAANQGINIGVSDWNATAQDNDGIQSSITNDVGPVKKLMIVGNRSGGGARRIGLWDDVEVNGGLNVTGGLSVGGNTSVTGNTDVTGIIKSKGLPVTTAKVIFGSKNLDVMHQYYKDEIVKEYKQSDPDGKNITFLFVFKGGQGGGDPLPIDINKDDESLWVRSYETFKQGNRVFIFFSEQRGAYWQKDCTVKIPN
jgi:hypothetical protein